MWVGIWYVNVFEWWPSISNTLIYYICKNLDDMEIGMKKMEWMGVILRGVSIFMRDGKKLVILKLISLDGNKYIKKYL